MAASGLFHTMRVAYAFQAAGPGELSVHEGELVVEIAAEAVGGAPPVLPGWSLVARAAAFPALGEVPAGAAGYVPTAYLEPASHGTEGVEVEVARALPFGGVPTDSIADAVRAERGLLGDLLPSPRAALVKREPVAVVLPAEVPPPAVVMPSPMSEEEEGEGAFVSPAKEAAGEEGGRTPSSAPALAYSRGSSLLCSPSAEAGFSTAHNSPVTPHLRSEGGAAKEGFAPVPQAEAAVLQPAKRTEPVILPPTLPLAEKNPLAVQLSQSLARAARAGSPVRADAVATAVPALAPLPAPRARYSMNVDELLARVEVEARGLGAAPAPAPAPPPARNVVKEAAWAPTHPAPLEAGPRAPASGTVISMTSFRAARARTLERPPASSLRRIMLCAFVAEGPGELSAAEGAVVTLQQGGVAGTAPAGWSLVRLGGGEEEGCELGHVPTTFLGEQGGEEEEEAAPPAPTPEPPALPAPPALPSERETWERAAYMRGYLDAVRTMRGEAGERAAAVVMGSTLASGQLGGEAAGHRPWMSAASFAASTALGASRSAATGPLDHRGRAPSNSRLHPVQGRRRPPPPAPVYMSELRPAVL
jgi:hypothetical protein